MSATSIRFNQMWQFATSFMCNHKRIIIEVFSVVAFLILFGLTVSKCSYYKNANDNNIIALTDSVKYYKGKLGNEVAKKTLVETDYKNLQLINDSLYRLVNSISVKNPDIVIGSNVSIDNKNHDTVWIATDAEKKSSYIYRDFNFTDKYRELCGTVNYSNDTLGLHIEKDKVQFKYALAIKNNQVYMTSDNPYVKFNTITGLKIPEQKRIKKFGIGPVIYGGYGNKGWQYGIGIGLQYNFINF